MRAGLLCLAACLWLGAAAAREHGRGPLLVDAKRKPADVWKEYPTRTIDSLADYDMNTTCGKLSPYGGLLSGRVKATGFFRTEKIGDRWWLIDPDGCRFIHVGVVSVRTGSSTGSREALEARFGSEEKWARQTAELLAGNGFNGTGGWSDMQALGKAPRRLVYTVMHSFMSAYGQKRGGTFRQPGHTGYPNDCIFVFDPEFETFCDSHARRLAATSNDPWLLGYFSDNELPFKPDTLDKFLGLPKTDPGHKEAQRWLRERRGANGATRAAPTGAERAAFLCHVVDRYYDIVSKAIRRHDPNHLYLGTRFNGPAVRTPEVFRAAGRHADVISVNYYNAWTPRNDRMEMWLRESRRPCIISEFYTKGEDAGLGNSSGAGWIVRTQIDRGRFYQNYVLGLIESRSCVGWHWFRYMDNDPADTSTDPSNRDSNKGIVTARYVPYGALLGQMQQLNARVYPLIEYFDRGGPRRQTGPVPVEACLPPAQAQRRIGAATER